MLWDSAPWGWWGCMAEWLVYECLDPNERFECRERIVAVGLGCAETVGGVIGGSIARVDDYSRGYHTGRRHKNPPPRRSDRFKPRAKLVRFACLRKSYLYFVRAKQMGKSEHRASVRWLDALQSFAGVCSGSSRATILQTRENGVLVWPKITFASAKSHFAGGQA